MLQASGKHQYNPHAESGWTGRTGQTMWCRRSRGVSGQVREREAAREGQGEKRAWSGIRGVAGLEEFLVGETGAARMRSLVAVPPSRQAAEPSAAQASLPCCQTGDAPALRCTESRGSHHPVPRTRICERDRHGRVTSVYYYLGTNERVRHSAILLAAVPCVSRCLLASIVHSQPDTQERQEHRGKEVFDIGLIFSRTPGQDGIVGDRRVERQTTDCRPLNVARHARAVRCNAMQFSEHKPRQEEGARLGALSDEGALTWSAGLRFWALHGPPMARGRLVRPCCDPALKVAQCLACRVPWAMAIAPDSSRMRPNCIAATASGPRTVCYV